MVDPSNIVSTVGGEFVEKIFSGLLWFGVAIIFVGVIGFLGWWFLIYKKKFNILVKITSERAGDRNRIVFDKAAILKDRKDKSMYFRIWGMKLDLPAPKFNVLQSTSDGDYLELYRTSENRIYYLTPSLIDKKNIIQSDGKLHALAVQTNKQIDPDMDFWGQRRMTENKKMFDTESMFMKLLPYLPAIMGGFITIFILYILLDHLPGILTALTQLVQEMKSLKGADVTIGLAFLRLAKW